MKCRYLDEEVRCWSLAYMHASATWRSILYLDASCQMLIVEVGIWPEAKIEGVHNQQVLGCQWTVVTQMKLCRT